MVKTTFNQIKLGEVFHLPSWPANFIKIRKFTINSAIFFTCEAVLENEHEIVYYHFKDKDVVLTDD